MFEHVCYYGNRYYTTPSGGVDDDFLLVRLCFFQDVWSLNFGMSNQFGVIPEDSQLQLKYDPDEKTMIEFHRYKYRFEQVMHAIDQGNFGSSKSQVKLLLPMYVQQASDKEGHVNTGFYHFERVNMAKILKNGNVKCIEFIDIEPSYKKLSSYTSDEALIDSTGNDVDVEDDGNGASTSSNEGDEPEDEVDEPEDNNQHFDIELLHDVKVRQRKQNDHQIVISSEFFLPSNHSLFKEKIASLFSIPKEIPAKGNKHLLYMNYELFTNSLFALIVFGMTFNEYPPRKFKLHFNMLLKHQKSFVSNMSVVLKKLESDGDDIVIPEHWNTQENIEKTQTQDEHFESIALMLAGKNHNFGDSLKHVIEYHKKGKLSKEQTELLLSLNMIELKP